MQLTERQKFLIRAHYGDADMRQVQADLDAGNAEYDWDGLEQDHGREYRTALLEAMTDHERGMVLAYVTGRWPEVFDAAVDGSPTVDAAELERRIGGADDGAPCGLCTLRAERGIEPPPGGCTCQGARAAG